MAIIDAKGIVYGKAGPVVYRRYRNMNIFQSRPRKYKQTAATIRSSAEFGVASSTGCVVRQAFEPLYRHHDGAAVGRITSAVYQCIRAGHGAHGKRDLHQADLGFLSGLEFNGNSRLADVLPVKPQVQRGKEGEVIVHIPAFDTNRGLREPASLKPGRIRFRLMLLAFHFHDQYFEYVDVKDIEIPARSEMNATDVVLEGAVPAGAILMLGMSVMLLRKDMVRLREFTEINSREYSPAAILAAWQPDVPTEVGYRAFWKEYGRQREAGQKRDLRMMSYCGSSLISGVDHRVTKKARKGPLITVPKTTKASAVAPAAETEQLKGKRVMIKRE